MSAISAAQPLDIERTRASRRRNIPLVGVIASIVLGLIVLGAVFAPWLSTFDPHSGNLDQRLLGLGVQGHLLGTDGLGRDVFARLLWGARISLVSGLVPVVAGAVIGGGLGVAAGLAGRSAHSIVMRTLDVFYAFPVVLLAIAIAASLGRGMVNIIVALTIVNIPPIARVTEVSTVSLRELHFMDAARSSGAGRWAIAFRQVVPNVLPTVAVYSASLIGLTIVSAAGLSFLGLGVQAPTPEWGLMVNEARQYTFSHPAVAMVPAITIALVSLVCNLAGEGFRAYLDLGDPRLTEAPAA